MRSCKLMLPAHVLWLHLLHRTGKAKKKLWQFTASVVINFVCSQKFSNLEKSFREQQPTGRAQCAAPQVKGSKDLVSPFLCTNKRNLSSMRAKKVFLTERFLLQFHERRICHYIDWTRRDFEEVSKVLPFCWKIPCTQPPNSVSRLKEKSSGRTF